MDLSLQAKSNWIKSRAKQLGFDACGIAKAHCLDEEVPRLTSYLDNNYQGEMGYLANHFQKRVDPRLLVQGARSVVVVLMNYFPEHIQTDSTAPVIAKYAYGKDYHYVVKERLQQLMESLNQELGDVQGRAFVDSAPVLEHAWAQRAGLGWIGKNSLLLTQELGSFVFIGELIIDMELAYDDSFSRDYCGTCTRCIDACPTGAIVAPHIVNGSKCISYYTIELKGDIPSVMKGKFQNRVFGCDICQDVCPWNSKAKPHKISDFNPDPQLLEMDREQMMNLDHDTYLNVFRNSAVKRTKFKGLKRNLDFLDNH